MQATQAKLGALEALADVTVLLRALGPPAANEYVPKIRSSSCACTNAVWLRRLPRQGLPPLPTFSLVLRMTREKPPQNLKASATTQRM